MANAIVEVTEGSGKKIDNESLSVGGNTAHRQRVQVSGASALEIAAVINSLPSTEYGLVVRAVPTLYDLELAKGNIPGHSAVFRHGRNPDIDIAAAEDIWAFGGTRNYLTAAETVDVVSTSTDDDGSPAGIGLHTLFIEGLDANYDVISETLTMDGTTAVTSANSYLRQYLTMAKAVGSSGENVGTLTTYPTTTGIGSPHTQIAAASGLSNLSHYTIPNAKTGYIRGVSVAVDAGTKGASLKFCSRAINEAWLVQAEFPVRSAGSSFLHVQLPAPLEFAAKTDLRWTASVDANDTSVVVLYTIELVDD